MSRYYLGCFWQQEIENPTENELNPESSYCLFKKNFRLTQQFNDVIRLFQFSYSSSSRLVMFPLMATRQLSVIQASHYHTTCPEQETVEAKGRDLTSVTPIMSHLKFHWPDTTQDYS